MKIGLASDLHLEFHRTQNTKRLSSGKIVHADHHARPEDGHPFFGPDWSSLKSQVDLVLLPGDIDVDGHQYDYVRVLADYMEVPVLYVAGNHEFYHSGMEDIKADQCKKASAWPDVFFLDNDVVEFKDHNTRIIGSTLWTDYELFGAATVYEAMNTAQLSLNDHRLIRYNDQYFATTDALALHQKARTFIEDELSKDYEGKTIVMTHHGVSLKSCAPQYKNDILSAAFCSDLENLFGYSDVDLVVHGHTHNQEDYHLGDCRVVVNPIGYPGERADNPVPIIIEV